MPDWIIEFSGLIGVGMSVVAVGISLGALRESKRQARLGPVRQLLQQRLPEVTHQLAVLTAATGVVHTALNERVDLEQTADAMSEQQDVIRQCMADLIGLNIPDLAGEIRTLVEVTVAPSADGASVVERITRLVHHDRQLAKARADLRADDVRSRDALEEATRRQDRDFLELARLVGRADMAAERVRLKVRQLEATGLGDGTRRWSLRRRDR